MHLAGLSQEGSESHFGRRGDGRSVWPGLEAQRLNRCQSYEHTVLGPVIGHRRPLVVEATPAAKCPGGSSHAETASALGILEGTEAQRNWGTGPGPLNGVGITTVWPQDLHSFSFQNCPSSGAQGTTLMSQALQGSAVSLARPPNAGRHRNEGRFPWPQAWESGLQLLPAKLRRAGLGYSGFSMTPGPNLSSRKRR